MGDVGFPLISRPGQTVSSQGHSGAPVFGIVAGVPSSSPGGFIQSQSIPGMPISAQVKPLPIAGIPGRGRVS